MDGPEHGGPAARSARRIRRLVALAWTILAIVVWNVVFDAVVTQAGREYLTRQALHRQGRGPAVTIRQVMDPGVARGARVATASSGALWSAGMLALWVLSRRRAGHSAGRSE